MTAPNAAAFTAGINHAADPALVAALALEIREDARNVRQQAAIAALRGLAEALKSAPQSGFVVPTQYLQQASDQLASSQDADTGVE